MMFLALDTHNGICQIWVPNPGSGSVCHNWLGINESDGDTVPPIWTPSSSTGHVKEEMTQELELAASPWTTHMHWSSSLFVLKVSMWMYII